MSDDLTDTNEDVMRAVEIADDAVFRMIAAGIGPVAGKQALEYAVTMYPLSVDTYQKAVALTRRYGREET